MTDDEALYYRKIALHYCLRSGVPQDMREDKAHDALIAVMKLEKRYKGDAPFRAVAAKRIRWELLEYRRVWRRRQARVKMMAAPGSPNDARAVLSPGDAHATVDAKDAVAKLLEQIPNGRHRCVLGLMSSGWSRREAAGVVGLSDSRISQLMSGEWKPLALAMMA